MTTTEEIPGVEDPEEAVTEATDHTTTTMMTVIITTITTEDLGITKSSFTFLFPQNPWN